MRVVGTKRTISIKLRAEIEGQPVIAGMNGPMYGGPGVCRYEISAKR